MLAFASLGLSCAQTCPGGNDAGVPPPIEDAGPPADPFHDPLSTPEEPTLEMSNFTPAATCGDCHEQQYADWRKSMHAYAMVDPVFRKLVEVRQQDFSGTQDQFCTQCHTPMGTRAGAIVDNFVWDELDEKVLDGVSCETCHKAVAVERTHNSGLVINDFIPMQGPIQNPEISMFHASQYSELQSSPELCGACHDVVETSGLNLERPYEEWFESPARAKGTTCQECHMPAAVGPAAKDGPERDLRRHVFLGVDVPLLEGWVTEEEVTEIRTDVRELLEGSGSLRLAAEPTLGGDQLDLYVTVKNELDAHNLPTGSTFIRQMWIEVTATDAEGSVLYRTGDLDDNGDLRDAFSDLDPYGDDDLLRLSSVLINEAGIPEIFTWRATEHITFSLSPLYERTYTLFVPLPADVMGPVHIEARLLFRTHGPYVMRALGLPELIDKLEVYEVATSSLEVPVLGP